MVCPTCSDELRVQSSIFLPGRKVTMCLRCEIQIAADITSEELKDNKGGALRVLCTKK
jgi:hypothetical protein